MCGFEEACRVVKIIDGNLGLDRLSYNLTDELTVPRQPELLTSDVEGHAHLANSFIQLEGSLDTA